MSTNREKFLKLVTEDNSNTLEWAKERQKNRKLERFSQRIALAILRRLDDINWSQTKLADAMGVSKQQVNKWVKGGENFTIDTILKIEDALDIKLIDIPEPSDEISMMQQTEILELPYEQPYTNLSKDIDLKSMIVGEEEHSYQIGYTK